MMTPGKQYVMRLEYVSTNPVTGLHIFNVVGRGMQVEMALVEP